MKVLAFGTSNNRQSINRSLAGYAAGLVEGASVEILDINDYEMPIFSDEREQELGQPPQALAFSQKIAEADALVVSFAEHNGSYTAAYKNLFDWVSRIDRAVFQDKPVVYLATSPGPGGAAGVLAAAVGSAAHFGARLIASLSVPRFQNNFDSQAGHMTNPSLLAELKQAMQLLNQATA
ncbi:MAG: NAD(P)H-dependent oxidoreductase [Halieaceae bacterium]